MKAPWCGEAVYGEVGRFAEVCLINDGSLLAIQSRTGELWTLERLEGLSDLIDDRDGDSFASKLDAQLADRCPSDGRLAVHHVATANGRRRG